jgi:uncharacterized protein with FMN-binding domain
MLNARELVLIVFFIIVLIVAILGVKYLIPFRKYKKIVKGLEIGNVNLSKVSDGTYTGYCDAVYVAAKVSITVKNHKIADIILLSHKNDGGKLAEVIPGKVLKAQSLEVDTISGATNSSKVILKSIENALKAGEL